MAEAVRTVNEHEVLRVVPKIEDRFCVIVLLYRAGLAFFRSGALPCEPRSLPHLVNG